MPTFSSPMKKFLCYEWGESSRFHLRQRINSWNPSWWQTSLPAFAPIYKLFHSISNELKSSNSVLVKADKGEALVAFPASDYHNKMTNFLQTSGALPSTMEYDYYIRKIRRSILSSHLVVQDKKQRESVLVMNPSPPCLYGQLKTHKPSFPIRLVVAYYTKASYKLRIIFVLLHTH